MFPLLCLVAMWIFFTCRHKTDSTVVNDIGVQACLFLFGFGYVPKIGLHYLLLMLVVNCFSPRCLTAVQLFNELD